MTVTLLLGLAACTPPRRLGAVADGAPPGAAAALPSAASLAFLREHVGVSPHEFPFWSREPMRSRLTSLLGADFATFAGRMRTADPIAADGDLVYVTGGHRAGTAAAVIFMADIPADALHVWLVRGKSIRRYQEVDRPVVLPARVLDLLADAAEAGAR